MHHAETALSNVHRNLGVSYDTRNDQVYGRTLLPEDRKATTSRQGADARISKMLNFDLEVCPIILDVSLENHIFCLDAIGWILDGVLRRFTRGEWSVALCIVVLDEGTRL